jgi:serine/tyrosine/threonine adenylyltransferase
VQRERVEPGAIVARFAETWLRLGTFDLPRSRGDRKLLRQLATYAATHVFGGWERLPGQSKADREGDTVAVEGGTAAAEGERGTAAAEAEGGIPADTIEGEGVDAENRFVRLFRHIVRLNARTVAAWQAYGFMNGVLNTDNTSIFGLSMDFGPFAFMDNFDPSYTPNHDDFMLRYSYRNQPTIIWWNLVRLAEALGELIGAAGRCDDAEFVEKGVTKEVAEELVQRAEHLIEKIGEEYKYVFMSEYRRLMTARLGLKQFKEADFEDLYSELLDSMEALELDFNGFFRKLGTVERSQLATEDQRKLIAAQFFHPERKPGDDDLERLAKWLAKWAERVSEDWGDSPDKERQDLMQSVNPNVSWS